MKAGRRRFCSKQCKYAYANPSGLELKARAWLAGWGIDFEAQTPFGRWHADLYVPARRLVIEVNGCYYHSCTPCGYIGPNPDSAERDHRKAAWLRSRGYQVLVIWEHDFGSGRAESMLRSAVT
jgi:DNA mismatch endonuclease (patch repair protein)